MGWNGAESLLGQGRERNVTRDGRLGRRRFHAPPARLLVAIGLFTLGCESVLGLNHDYAIRADGTGGTSVTPSSGLTNPSATGGAPVSGAGGSASTASAVGGADVGGTSSASFSSGGVGTSSVTWATSTGGLATSTG